MVTLGIDFGTSSTVAVVELDDGRAVPLLFGETPLLPSAVSMSATGELAVGRDAMQAARGRPQAFEPHPKARIDDGEVLLGERAVPVAELVGAVLWRVHDEAVRVAGSAVGRLVLTHPAGWGARRRQTLLDAAARTGLPAPVLVAEPVAAAAYYAHVLGHEVGLGRCVVVYDFGAGTFDASVVRRTAGGFEVLAEEGIPDAGGLDIDAAIVAYLGAVHGAGDPDGWQRLMAPAAATDRRMSRAFWDDVRAGKEALSRTSMTTVFMPIVELDAVLGREQLDHLARPLLNRTVAATQLAIRNAAIGRDDIAAVFLVGGSSRMPLVATLLHRSLGIAPTVVEQPELIVAGGTLHAHGLQPAVAAPESAPAVSSASLPLPASPVSSVPMASAPVPSMPMAPFPVSSVPLAPSPVSAAPVSPSPLAPFPVSSAPVAPVSPVPVQQVPTQPAAPVQAAALPVHGDPPPGPVQVAPAPGRRRRRLVAAAAAAAVTVAAVVVVIALRFGPPSGGPENTPSSGAAASATGPALRPERLATLEHSGSVLAAAFAPGGSVLATAGGDGSNDVTLWNTTNPATAARIATLQGHEQPVTSVAFSPDGRTVATASLDKTAILWNVADPARPVKLKTLTDHANVLLKVVFSPQGSLIATTGTDQSVLLWNVADPAAAVRVGSMAGQNGLSLAFSPDGKAIVTAEDKERLVVWSVADPRSPSRIAELDLDTEIGHIAFARDGRTMAVSGTKNIVLLDATDLTKPSRLGAVEAKGTVFSVQLSPAADIMAAGGADNAVTLWDVSDPAKPATLAVLSDHKDEVTAVAFDRTGAVLATASSDKTTMLWGLSKG